MPISPWILSGFVVVSLASVACHSSKDLIGAATADGACSDSSGNRFVDCGNGTVTDTNPGHVTNAGLIWLKNADCVGVTTWVGGTSWAYGLKSGDCGLSDNSAAGDWRLPSKAEWEAILKSGCAPSLPNAADNGCFSTGGWASGVSSLYYWSSSPNAADAWAADMTHALVQDSATANNLGVWAVRGGP